MKMDAKDGLKINYSKNKTNGFEENKRDLKKSQ